MGSPDSPAVPIALAFASGIAARQALDSPPPSMLLAGALVALGLALGSRSGRCLAAAAAGLVVATHGAPPRAPLVEGRVAEVTGRVAGRWHWRPGGAWAELNPERLALGDRTWWGRQIPELRLDLDDGLGRPPAGTPVRARGVLARPAGFANEIALAPGRWRLRVKAACFLESRGPPGPWDRLAEVWRSWIRAPYLLPERAACTGVSLGRAFVLGDGEALPERWRRAMRRTGLAHLIAVSGYNVSLVAALAAAAGCYLPRLGRLALIGAAVGLYALAVGPGPSVLRAALTALLAVGGLACGRVPLARQGLALVLVGSLAWEPSWSTDPGFQLSFAATAGLLWLAPRWAARWSRRWPRPLALGVAATCAAQAAALPWSVAAFGTLSPAAPLFNLLAAPWAALTLTASLGWTALALAAPSSLGTLAARGLTPLTWPLDGLAMLPPSPLISSPWPGGWWAGLLAGGLLAAWAEGGRWRRGVLLIALAALVSGHGRRPDPGFEVAMLDVGQGDATLLVHGDEAILVDGGGKVGWNLGGRVLRPLLALRGITRLRLAVVTHADADHCLGLVDLAEELPIDEIWAPAGALAEHCVAALARASGRAAMPRRGGERLERAGFEFEVVHPASTAPRESDNRVSLVLRVSAGGRRVLLAADIDAEVERRLLAGGAPLAADLLKVPHHGSQGSTSPAFLAAVRPRLAVVSAGTGNSYGHPGRATLERLERAGTRVLRTDRDGAVEIRWAAGGPWRIRLPGSPPWGRLAR